MARGSGLVLVNDLPVPMDMAWEMVGQYRQHAHRGHQSLRRRDDPDDPGNSEEPVPGGGRTT